MANSNLYNIKFGAFLKKKRLEHGYTQQKLADKLGVHKTTVARYESGKFMPDDSVSESIRRILSINVLEYYGAKEGWNGNKARVCMEYNMIDKDYNRENNGIFELADYDKHQKINNIFNDNKT